MRLINIKKSEIIKFDQTLAYGSQPRKKRHIAVHVGYNSKESKRSPIILCKYSFAYALHHHVNLYIILIKECQKKPPRSPREFRNSHTNLKKEGFGPSDFMMI